MHLLFVKMAGDVGFFSTLSCDVGIKHHSVASQSFRDVFMVAVVKPFGRRNVETHM